MNERIRELYLHAFPPSLNDSTVCQMSAEKFAESIVRECAEIALVDGQSTGNFEVFNKIQKHFGVKE
jgi:hypothetical protein